MRPAFPAKREGQSTVNARKTNRRCLTMLGALVAITVFGDGVGLIIHYGFTLRHSVARDMPITHDLARKGAVSVLSVSDVARDSNRGLIAP